MPWPAAAAAGHTAWAPWHHHQRWQPMSHGWAVRRFRRCRNARMRHLLQLRPVLRSLQLTPVLRSLHPQLRPACFRAPSRHHRRRGSHPGCCRHRRRGSRHRRHRHRRRGSRHRRHRHRPCRIAGAARRVRAPRRVEKLV